MSNQIFLINSSSIQDLAVSSSLRAGLSSVVDFTLASLVTGSFSGDGEHLKNVSASYVAVANIDGTPLAATSASFASESISSSNAISASYAYYASTSSYAFTSSYELTIEVSTSFASSSISSSYALSASSADAITFVPTTAASASWVSASAHIINSDTASYVLVTNIDGTPLSATSASFASASSWAVTASYVLGSGVTPTKRGIAPGVAFIGNPKTATITFTASFFDNNYSVVVSAESLRLFSIQNKDSGSFEINSNENTAFTENVFWQASYCGE